MGNTVRRIEFIRDLSHLLSYAESFGIELLFTSFHRTDEQQADLYAKGRTKSGKIVTHSDGKIKRSKHQDWEAVDLCIVKTREDGSTFLEWNRTPDYEKLGDYWKNKGHVWGGDWDLNDIYHFQL